MERMLHVLAAQPFVLLFVLVAVGYLLGKLQVKGVGLGATASTLLAGLVLSLVAQRYYGVALTIPEFASTVFFNLFMFAVGMRVGPQFISGLRRDAGRFIAIGVLIPVLAFGLVFVLRALFPLAPGFLPGIFAGANTVTPGLGAAQAALTSAAGHSTELAAEAVANMSTSFAFAYAISMIGLIIMTRVPDMFGANTPGQAKKFEAAVQGASGGAPLPGAADEFFSTTLPITVPFGYRTFEVEKPEVVGIPLGRLRETYPMLSIERIIRGGSVLEPSDSLRLALHDAVTLAGRIERLVTAGPHIGPEIYDRVAREVGAQTVDVIVQRSEVAGRKLKDLVRDIGHGLFLNALFRGGVLIPHGAETELQKGDVLRVTGSQFHIKTLEKEMGRVVRPSLATDIVTLSLGLTVGALLGSITIPLGGIRFALGSAVGLLLVGIAFSTLRTRHPAFGGPFPEPARELLEDIGLNVFVAILGVNAGAGVMQAISQGALTPILVGCLLVGFIPPVVAWLVGVKVLKMNTALLLGAVSGGRCNSAGMRASAEVSHSNVPAVSYPVTFAISNILLTLMSYALAMID